MRICCSWQWQAQHNWELLERLPPTVKCPSAISYQPLLLRQIAHVIVLVARKLQVPCVVEVYVNRVEHLLLVVNATFFGHIYYLLLLLAYSISHAEMFHGLTCCSRGSSRRSNSGVKELSFRFRMRFGGCKPSES